MRMTKTSKSIHKSGSKHSSPTLATVTMVEDEFRRHRVFRSQNHLSRILPRQVNNLTLKAVIDYLYRSKKITKEDEKLVWVFSDVDPSEEQLKKHAKKILVEIQERLDEK